MNIADMLRQPTEVQEQYIIAFAKRNDIICAMRHYNEASAELSKELIDIRKRCTHPLETYKKSWDEDEYGKTLESGYIDYICPDCGTRRTDIF